MPTFSFRCKKCGKAYDAFTSYSKIDTVTCPACGDKSKERIYKMAFRGPVNCGPPGSGFT